MVTSGNPVSRWLIPGQVVHHIKILGWTCGIVEATGRDWAVVRAYTGETTLIGHHGDGAGRDNWTHEHVAERCPYDPQGGSKGKPYEAVAEGDE